MSDELPDGWVWSTVGESYRIVGGGTPSTQIEDYWAGDIPWISSADIHGLNDIRPRKHISTTAIEHSATNLVPAGSIIVVTRVGLGKVAKADRAICFSQDSHALLTIERSPIAGYTLYYLSQAVQPFKYQNRGTTIVGVTKKQLADLPIPIPPPDEQHRIVAKIEKLFAESRTAREALDSVPALIKRFRQSVLAKSFRGELTERDPSDEPASALLERIRAERRTKSKKGVEPEPPDISGLPELPEGWAWTTLGSVFDISPGGTPSRKIADYWNGDIPWVSSGEVAFCRIKDTREKITRAGSDNSSAKVYPIGTVLLAMIGEGKTRGQCAILDIEAANNQNVAAIRCSKTPVPSEYLFYWLMYRYDETRGGGQGGAQPALNGERVRQIPLPLAPLAEQRRIVAKIEALFAQADAIEAAVNVARKRAQKVDQAILARAFRGEL